MSDEMDRVREETEEWRKRVNEAQTEDELMYQMNHKPKGAKTITSGVPVVIPAGAGDPHFPLLNQLLNAKPPQK